MFSYHLRILNFRVQLSPINIGTAPVHLNNYMYIHAHICTMYDTQDCEQLYDNLMDSHSTPHDAYVLASCT